jgi:hypothetical protein
MESDDLERLVDGALKRLPSPHAPDTLLPRVMAVVDASAHRVWYRRAWRTWPVAWQIASAIACAALVLLIASVGPVTSVGTVAKTAPASQVISDSVAFAGRMQDATGVAWTLWRVVLQPLVPYAFALAMLMCGACVVFGVALNYVVFGRTLHR